MYQMHEVKTLHFEVTSRCNASCPMCLRNVQGGKLNPHLPLTEWSLNDVVESIPVAFIQGLSSMFMCGNYGDPMVAKDTLEIFKYFREVSPKIHLSMITNGSGRSESWWRDLAKVVDRCTFSVDGLGETNGIYRRGTQFDRIMKNAKAFIQAGGKAHWDFIVFGHNEHQIEEAKVFSHSMGFEQIRFKKTGRFFSYGKGKKIDAQVVFNKEGEEEYFIKPPKNPEFYNGAIASEQDLIKEHGSFEKYLDSCEVDCKVLRDKSLYISAEGFVFPCCWTALRLYPWYNQAKGDPIWNLLDRLPEGVQSLNCQKQSLQKIIEGPFFQKMLPESWDQPSLGEGKLRVCAKTCGQKFDAFQAQFSGAKSSAISGKV